MWPNFCMLCLASHLRHQCLLQSWVHKVQRHRQLDHIPQSSFCLYRSRPTWLTPQHLLHLLLRQQQVATLPLLRRRRRRPRPKRRKSLMRTWAFLCLTRYVLCRQASGVNAVMANAVNGMCSQWHMRVVTNTMSPNTANMCCMA